MAIVQMKRLKLLGMKKDRDSLLKAMQAMGCVELTELEQQSSEQTPDAAGEQQLLKIRWALQKLAKWDNAKTPMFAMPPQISGDEAARVREHEKDLLGVMNELESIERSFGDLRGREARLRSQRDALLPWAALDATGDMLKDSAAVHHLCGTLPAKGLDALKEGLASLPHALEIIKQTQDTAYVYLALHRSAENEGAKVLDSVQFSAEDLRRLGAQTPKAAMAAMQQELSDMDEARKALDEQSRALACHIPDLKILHDLYEVKHSQQLAAQKAAETSSTFYMQGWIPASESEKLAGRLKKLSPSVALSFEDPKDDEQPGILLKNNKFASAFEPVVEGFSMPDYRSVDPTAIMAPFYVCLFGMMVSDAGYGLIMAVLLWLIIKIKKIPLKNGKMLYLLMFGGLSTIVWGVVFNTFIGFNPLPKFGRFFPLDPVNDPMPVMAVCLAMGAIHLFAGLGVAAYANLKKGDVVAAVSDQVSWALLLIGLGLLIVPSLAAAGKVLAMIGVALILVMTGRGKRNPIARLMTGLGALYGVTGWISDLLSYMRLFGMGLATGVIGMVFNILIGMVWSGGVIGKVFAVVLFLVCHLFNLGINALGAYVHSCRLQYIEFFGKFYQDGGKPFRPLTMKSRYVSLDKAGE